MTTMIVFCLFSEVRRVTITIVVCLQWYGQSVCRGTASDDNYRCLSVCIGTASDDNSRLSVCRGTASDATSRRPDT